MDTWDDYTLTCIHGVTESLDEHDCSRCRELTDEQFGKDHPTMVFLKEPRVKKAIEQEKELDKLLRKVTYTTKLPEEETQLARLAYRCPHCNKLNEMLVQPQPISLKRRCLHCDRWYEYTPAKE